MRIRVGMTAWRRPRYFRRVVEALRANPEADRFDCLLSIDGGYPRAQRLMRRIFEASGLRGTVIEQVDQLGCAANTGFVFGELFERDSDAVIMLEDDTVPAIDFLHYMTSMLERFSDSAGVFSVSAEHRRKHAPQPPLETARVVDEHGSWVAFDIREAMKRDRGRYSIGPGTEDGIFFRDNFSCLGWGTWRRVAEEIGDDWFGVTGGWDEVAALPYGDDFAREARRSPKGSWAWPMEKYWRRGRAEVAPDLSRIRNIGEKAGAFNPSAAWHRDAVASDFWMGSARGYRGSFRLLDFPTSGAVDDQNRPRKRSF